ncbi:hypothetical protein WH47_05940, partial [Habropoda laboriosa]
FCGKKTVDIATFTAAGIFNGGNNIFKMMQTMYSISGINSYNFCKVMDEQRIRNCEEKAEEKSKRARKLLKKAQKETADSFFDAKGLLYGLEIADQR